MKKLLLILALFLTNCATFGPSAMLQSIRDRENPTRIIMGETYVWVGHSWIKCEDVLSHPYPKGHDLYWTNKVLCDQCNRANERVQAILHENLMEESK